MWGRSELGDDPDVLVRGMPRDPHHYRRQSITILAPKPRTVKMIGMISGELLYHLRCLDTKVLYCQNDWHNFRRAPLWIESESDSSKPRLSRQSFAPRPRVVEMIGMIPGELRYESESDSSNTDHAHLSPIQLYWRTCINLVQHACSEIFANPGWEGEHLV